MRISHSNPSAAQGRQTSTPAATLGPRQFTPVTDSATFTTPDAGDDEETGDLLLEVLPGYSSTMGNQSAREALSGTEADRDMCSMHAGLNLLYPARLMS
jgi:hypothetical protein